MNSRQQHRDERQFHKPEVLSPAGSPEAFRAAVYAGADAVYVGGMQFGARAFASNLSEEELKEAIDFAHIYGVKVYLTINTLLKKKEIEEQLFSYLLPFYTCGLDAVIVQDIGVFAMVQQWFPDLDIHISTQMGVVSAKGAQLLLQLGAKRVVPGRELSLEEVRKITAIDGLEVECFVHGALCYCYSGQCFLSSRIGGRSGNRGRCAQPCRLPYKIGQDKAHFLSPKDIASIGILPDLIRAGITSFKIEGRMKKPEYVAAVTKLYRKYVDLAMECILYNREYVVESKDVMLLMQMYNRGGFHEGYYYQHNGADMMETGRVNHHGIYVGSIASIEKNKISFWAEETLYAGDVLELRLKEKGIELTCPVTIKVGELCTLNARELKQLSKGVHIYRLKSPHLIEVLMQEISCHNRKPISGKVKLAAETVAELTFTDKETGTSVTVYGERVERAQKMPITREQVQKVVSQLGNTAFVLEELFVEVGESVFLPVKILKDLRREGVEALQQALLSPYQRTVKKKEAAADNRTITFGRTLSSVREDVSLEDTCPAKTENTVEDAYSIKVIVSVKTMEQLFAVIEMSEVDAVILSAPLYEQAVNALSDSPQWKRKKWFLLLPRMFRLDEQESFKRSGVSSLQYLLVKGLEQADGCVISSVDALAWICHFAKIQDRSLFLLLEDTMYAYNQYAVDAWRAILTAFPHCSLYGTTLPAELSLAELSEITYAKPILPVYGSRVMMTSVQCVKQTKEHCVAKSGLTQLLDRKNKLFYMESNCNSCQNTLYEAEPLSLSKGSRDAKLLNPHYIRLDFLKESAEETRYILQNFINEYIYEDNGCAYIPGNTGHYYQTID